MRTATFFSNVNVLPEYFFSQPSRRGPRRGSSVGLLEVGVVHARGGVDDLLDGVEGEADEARLGAAVDVVEGLQVVRVGAESREVARLERAEDGGVETSAGSAGCGSSRGSTAGRGWGRSRCP
jgi:hypothetical protein